MRANNTTRSTTKAKKGTAMAAVPPPVQTIAAHKHQVSALCFSPQDTLLASGSYDSTVASWDVRTGKKIASQNRKDFRWAIVSVAFSPDDRTVASVSEGFKAQAKGNMQPMLYDLLSRQSTELAQSERFRWRYSSPAFSPDGAVVAFGGDAIQLFNVGTGERMGSPWDNSGCSVISLSPDGATLVSGHDRGRIKVWDMQQGKRLRRLEGHTDGVTSFCFSPDGRLLASGSDDPTIRLWDYQKGLEVHRFTGNWETTAYLAFLPGGQEVVSFHDPHTKPTVYLWTQRADQPLARWQAGFGVQAVSVHPAETMLATGDSEGTIRLWDLGTVLPTRNA